MSMSTFFFFRLVVYNAEKSLHVDLSEYIHVDITSSRNEAIDITVGQEWHVHIHRDSEEHCQIYSVI